VTRVVVLGAGPAGLGAAWKLAQRGLEVTLLERRDVVGGNAGSFDLAGLRVDYGSHRFHPAAEPEVLAAVRELLGPDLLVRPRHGRIRLRGRWVHFPLRAGDLLRHLPPGFALGAGVDLARRLLSRPAPQAEETFASVLERGLGRTICRDFYFPYARKIWGLEPDAIAPLQARRRVASASMGKLLRRLLPGSASGGGRSAKGVFYYPRRGYGQFSERLAEAAVAAGARLLLGAQVKRIVPGNLGPTVELEHEGKPQTLAAEHVFSTIPMTALAALLEPAAPEDVAAAARGLRFRAMLLVYLVLEQDRFSEYDAHYFPGAELRVTRVSEPKNYAAVREPRGVTALCAELPCDTSEPIWSLEPDALGRIVRDDLARAGIPVRSALRRVEVRRLAHAYPLYERGFEAAFERVDAFLSAQPRVLTFGRQGLYAHDNTHHALAMAFAAVRCLRDDGVLDEPAWAAARRVFETHVVED
jgi:protoporphyrinogen oxidase